MNLPMPKMQENTYDKDTQAKLSHHATSSTKQIT